jgi:hypothetical protein
MKFIDEEKFGKLTGVYRITNLVTGKPYFGSTSRSFDLRFNEHYCQLLLGIHYNTKLQNSFNKHGVESFIFEVIEICYENNSLEREQHYLDTELFAQEYINSKHLKGVSRDRRFIELSYNISPTAKGVKGLVWSQESKERQSKKLTKVWENPEYREKQSKIILKFYENHPEACLEHSLRIRKFYEEHPEYRERAREIALRTHKEKPYLKENHSKKMKQFFEDPKQRKRISDFFINFYSDELNYKELKRRAQEYWTIENKQKQSELKKKLYEDFPEKRDSARQKTLERNQRDPDVIERQKRGQKKFYEENPEAREEARKIALKYLEEHPEKNEYNRQQALNRPILTCEICEKGIKGKGSFDRHLISCKNKYSQMSEEGKEKEKLRLLNKVLLSCKYCNEKFKVVKLHEKLCTKNLEPTIEELKFRELRELNLFKPFICCCGRTVRGFGPFNNHKKFCKIFLKSEEN